MISPLDRGSAGAAMIVHLGEYLARLQRAVREGGSERLDMLPAELKQGE